MYNRTPLHHKCVYALHQLSPHAADVRFDNYSSARAHGENERLKKNLRRGYSFAMAIFIHRYCYTIIIYVIV